MTARRCAALALLIWAGVAAVVVGQPGPPAFNGRNLQVNKTDGNVSISYTPDYVGGFTAFQTVVRRRRIDYVECVVSEKMCKGRKNDFRSRR